MTPRDLGNTHNTRNNCRDALPCMNMALKLPQYFTLLMEKPVDCYFQVQSPYYQGTEWNQKTPIPVSNNKARFSFNQPNRKRWGKRWGSRLFNEGKHLLHKVFIL